MPKYKVTMNYVEAKCAQFVVKAKDVDDLHDLLGELDCDFLEANAGFQTCDYEPPIIEDYEEVGNNAKVNSVIQEAMDKVALELKEQDES